MSLSATFSRKPEAATLETFASLRFAGDRLQPSRLTELLRVAPTVAYCKGEVYKKVGNREVRGRTGLWLASSEGKANSRDLNDHLEYLLDIVFREQHDKILNELHELMQHDTVAADVGCFWYGERGARPPVIREDIRGRLARIPAEIELDFDTD